MIPGFRGLSLVNYGDKAIIFLPASLGYGERGGVIPPNANLIFEIEMFEKHLLNKNILTIYPDLHLQIGVFCSILGVSIIISAKNRDNNGRAIAIFSTKTTTIVSFK
jgi:hypothetical protein